MELTHLVESDDAGCTAEKLLYKKLRFSRTMIRKLKKHSGVKINGQRVWLNQRLQLGDIISIDLKSIKETDIMPQPIEIEIAYEDEYLLIVNKPPNMLTHPLKHEQLNTLANAVLYHYQQHKEDLNYKPVSRLDRNTSGLVVIAKDAYCNYQLARQLHTNNFIRQYTAVVHGRIRQPQGVIALPIARCAESKIKHMVDLGGRSALTYYQVEQHINDNTLLKLRLETGRTHQIRVHTSFIGFPLLGDDLYGGSKERINRQALHCHCIMLTHPVKKDRLVIKANLPKDMKRLIDKF